MAVVLGNLALSMDVTSSRTILPDRKSRPVAVAVAVEAVLGLNNMPRRESHALGAFIAGKWFESDGESRSQRVVARGKANSKVNGVDPGAGSSDEEGNGNGEWEEEEFDWEKEMRRRVKEIEERRELEKKAEELQSQLKDEDGDGGVEETEEEKRMRVRKELEKVAKEQAERRETAQLMFDLGQKAYGKGMYGRAIEFLEGALTIIPGQTLFGGEIQIWLAMAYEANNRHKDCIALYQQLEKRHPSVSIRRQAADLRYILQAPKLKISQEEMVTIPLIGSSYDSYAGTWTDKYKDNDRKSMGSTTNQLPSSRDFLGDFLVWRPPTGLEKSQGFWIALTLWLGLVGAALFLQN
ncbi:N-terminal acetyltransferase A, auxiliary subunit [Trema orientale]|uniref:N-terminal acetyltransferase A, auxiliary subunit n=1 Tax=Trema orientale TaxID=63057 RepID=A0A2P5FMN8_TREOI|nr:N-terminal acetyltransferase A, auxiliary subunit [Trema orientale]